MFESCRPIQQLVLSVIKTRSLPCLPRRLQTTISPSGPNAGSVSRRSVFKHSRNEIAKINGLLIRTRKLLSSKEDHDVENYILRNLENRAQFYNSSRHLAFHRIIDFLLRRRLFQPASVIYDRMIHEGFIPPNSIRIKMTVISMMSTATDKETLIASLMQIFRDNSVEIPDFMELIDFASNDKKAPIDEVDALARAYFDARGLTVNLPADVVGDLVTANVHEGRMDTAQEWLEKFEERCSVDGKQPTAAPYAAFLNAAKDLDPYNTAAFETILDRMKIEGVVPDIHVFNALITAHCIRKHYAAAFAVYRILIEKPSMYPTPNDITYKTLVRATKCVSLQRASRSRRLKPPSNMVPVRQLYHDMLKCHIKQTSGRISKSSDIISPSILQFSLRTFLDIRDYAGAIIVLNSMDMLGYRPNIETYFLVLKHFLERMKTELGRKYPENEQYWTKVILKMGTEGAMNSPGSRKAQPSIGPQTVAFLMRLGEPRRLARDISEDDPQNMSDISQSSTSNTYKYPSSTSRFRLPRSYRVPTMRMLLGKELVLPSIRFSTVPLVRIIRKALMASLITKVKPEDSDQSQEDVLVSIMTSAKRDMVPSLPEGTEGIYSRPEPDKRKWSSSRAVHVFPNGTDKLKRGSG